MDRSSKCLVNLIVTILEFGSDSPILDKPVGTNGWTGHNLVTQIGRKTNLVEVTMEQVKSENIRNW